MSLMQEIENYKKDTFPRISKDTLVTLLRMTDELVKSGIARKAVKEGDRIPSFGLKDAHGKTVSSGELLEKGPLVISFYRGGWCSFCSLELRALQKHHAEIIAHGGTLVAISPQLPDHSLQTVEKNHLEFHVLSDANNSVARSFGLVYELIKELANLYRLAFDLDLTKINGTDKFELPIPATYVVDRTGVIKHSYIDADYTKRMEPADIIETLKTLQ